MSDLKERAYLRNLLTIASMIELSKRTINGLPMSLTAGNNTIPVTPRVINMEVFRSVKDTIEKRGA